MLPRRDFSNGRNGDDGGPAMISGATSGRILLLFLDGGGGIAGANSGEGERRRLGLLFWLETFPCFFDVDYVDGGRVPVVVHGRMEHSNNFICRSFGISDSFFVLFQCIGAPDFCVLLWVACALHLNGNTESVTFNMVLVGRRLGSFIGGLFIEILSLHGVFLWRLWFHCSGGLLPLLGVLWSGKLGFWTNLEAPDLWSSGEAMAGGHLQPRRSAT